MSNSYADCNASVQACLTGAREWFDRKLESDFSVAGQPSPRDGQAQPQKALFVWICGAPIKVSAMNESVIKSDRRAPCKIIGIFLLPHTLQCKIHAVK